MLSSRQARTQLEEKALEAYREEHFRGSARVRLDCLNFEKGFGHMMDDGRNKMRLERILEMQGCLRINRDYHVPVLVDATDWGHRVTTSHDANEPFPELVVPLNMSLRALDHENIIAVARKRLYGENRWWVVDVYVEDRSEQPDRESLHLHLVRSLREHFPNHRQPPDGLIYERLRLYEGQRGHPPDQNAANAWWAILQHNPRSKKHIYLKAFLRHGSFPQAFDILLSIPGLWSKMHLGVLHTMMSLRCDEPILSYLETIRNIWIGRIFNGNEALAAHADAETVMALESRVPKFSNQDLKFVQQKMQEEQTLFPSISDPGLRNAIWERLQLIDIPIPTLGTFFQDLRFLGVARKVMQALLLPSEGSSSRKEVRKITIDSELDSQHRAGADVILRDRRLRVRRGLHELWRFSFQYGLEMTGVARRQLKNQAGIRRSIPTWNGSNSIDRMALWRHLYWLADQQGFRVPAIENQMPQSVSLPTPQAREDLQNTDDDDEPVHRRCGIPYVGTEDADRFALDGNRPWEAWETRRVTVEFIRRSQFRAFFQYLRDEIDENQTRSTVEEPIATQEAEIPHEVVLDHVPNGNARSPGIPELPSLDSMFDWTAYLGPDWVDMPTGGLEVTIVIPNHNPNKILLPNDGPSINQFFDGLRLRGFGFYATNNRTLSKEEDFYQWHQRNPWETVEARLTEESVQDYTTSEQNRQKRRRKGVSETLAEVAMWVEEQRARLHVNQ